MRNLWWVSLTELGKELDEWGGARELDIKNEIPKFKTLADF